MTQFVKRVQAIDISGIRKMFEGAGPNAINMGLGQPDVDTPENIKAAAVAAPATGKTGYTNNAGIDELLREAVAAKLSRENHIPCFAGNVIITAGGTGALNIAVQSLVENSGKVVFNDPGFVSYGALTSDLHLDVEALKEQFSDPKTKVFVLNNPANPTGMVETPETVRAVVESAADAGVTAISEEVYEKFCYGDTKFVSAAVFGDNVITINATSKTYAMTRWQIGFLVASEEIIHEVVKVQQYTIASPTSIAQYAALEAYTGLQDSVAAMKTEYEARRDLLIAGLHKNGGFGEPPGRCALCVPADNCGCGRHHHAKMSYATSQENIKKALDRMAKVVG